MSVLQRLHIYTGLCALLCLTAVQCWKVDCTKFVFAPRCRGVAAKRSSQTSADDVIRDSANTITSSSSFLSKLAQLQKQLEDEVNAKAASYRVDLLLSEPVARDVRADDVDTHGNSWQQQQQLGSAERDVINSDQLALKELETYIHQLTAMTGATDGRAQQLHYSYDDIE